MSALTNASFAAIAARITQKAASWAADPMQAIGESTIPAGGTVARSTAEKFCAEIEAHLQLIRRLASEPAPLPRPGGRR